MQFPTRAGKKVTIVNDENGYTVSIDGAMTIPCADVKTAGYTMDDGSKSYLVAMFNDDAEIFAQALTKKVVYQ